MQVRGSFAFVAAALLGTLFVLGTWYAVQALRGTATLATSSADVATPPALETAALEIPVPELTPADRAFIRSLRADPRLDLSRPRTRIQALQQVAAYAEAREPRAGHRLVAAMLAELEPVAGPDLLDDYLKLGAYRRWLDARREELAALPPARRRAELWEARRRAFGRDADAIWQAELGGAAVATAVAP